MNGCTLPTTGIDIWPFIGIGLLLLLGGVVAIAIARRKVAPIIAAAAVALLAIGGLTLAPAGTASAACPPPIARADANTVTANTAPNPVDGNVLTNDSDPDGFAIHVTNGGGSIAMTFGTLSLGSNGTYSYTLNNAIPAVNDLLVGHTLTDVYHYAIADTQGGTASTTLTITIDGSNHNPVANPDVNAMDADATPDTITGNVLANDTDADGDPLAVTTLSAMVGTYGALLIANSGAYTYELNETNTTVENEPIGSSLTDTFTYSISDGRGGTSSSTVTITINGTFENIQ
ncbi:MAG TPA: VCBS domain-containing protein [Galbitalea sp.]|jgi:VCBS repeat-containing protein|nr:VCBS domain-containing protein [Galbitalea sp.]